MKVKSRESLFLNWPAKWNHNYGGVDVDPQKSKISLSYTYGFDRTTLVARQRSSKQTLVSCIRSSSRDEPRSGPRALEPESRAWARREELLGTESVAPGVCSDGSGTVQQEREGVVVDHVRTGEAVRHGRQAELGTAVVEIESVCGASTRPVTERRVV